MYTNHVPGRLIMLRAFHSLWASSFIPNQQNPSRNASKWPIMSPLKSPNQHTFSHSSTGLAVYGMDRPGKAGIEPITLWMNTITSECATSQPSGVKKTEKLTYLSDYFLLSRLGQSLTREWTGVVSKMIVDIVLLHHQVLFYSPLTITAN